MPAPWLLALGLVIALLVLIPAKRLQLAGLASRTIGLYALTLWVLAMVVAIAPTATRVVIPMLLVAYIAPFVVAPEAIGRIARRGPPPDPPRPPVKNVTPPDDGGP